MLVELSILYFTNKFLDSFNKGFLISFLGPKQPKEKKPKKEKEEKPKKAPAKPKAKAPAKKANPWEDESGSGDDFEPVEKKERDGIRRAAAAKSKYVEDSGSDSDMFA